MTATITWSINTLERLTSDGYVYTAHYRVDGADDSYKAGAYGSQPFERPETLIPFADLTEDIVIGWVKDTLGAEKVASIEAAIQSQIDEQRTPSKATGTPW